MRPFTRPNIARNGSACVKTCAFEAEGAWRFSQRVFCNGVGTRDRKRTCFTAEEQLSPRVQAMLLLAIWPLGACLQSVVVGISGQFQFHDKSIISYQPTFQSGKVP